MFDTSKKFYIYGLFYEDEYGDNVCFYIGKGKGERYKHHLTRKRVKNRNTHKSSKIEKLREEGKDPFGIILCPYLSEEQAYEIERGLLDRDGLFRNLTNLVRGGKGGWSGEKHPLYGKSRSEETKQKISAAKSGKSLTEEHRENIKKSLSDVDTHPGREHIENLREIRKGSTHSEQTKRQIANAKQGQSYGPQSDEHRRKIGEANKGDNNGSSQLTEEEAREVKYLAQKGELTQKEIADKYDINSSTVSRIKRGKRWKHIEPLKTT